MRGLLEPGAHSIRIENLSSKLTIQELSQKLDHPQIFEL